MGGAGRVRLHGGKSNDEKKRRSERSGYITQVLWPNARATAENGGRSIEKEGRKEGRKKWVS
jgi:hypothetical protein